jgi:hypothetical protein
VDLAFVMPHLSCRPRGPHPCKIGMVNPGGDHGMLVPGHSDCPLPVNSVTERGLISGKAKAQAVGVS